MIWCSILRFILLTLIVLSIKGTGDDTAPDIGFAQFVCVAAAVEIYPRFLSDRTMIDRTIRNTNCIDIRA